MAPSNEGLQCACGFHIWRDLDYRVVGGVWEWRCPVTGEVLSRMPWSPPRDMPLTSNDAADVDSGGNPGTVHVSAGQEDRGAAKVLPGPSSGQGYPVLALVRGL